MFTRLLVAFDIRFLTLVPTSHVAVVIIFLFRIVLNVVDDIIFLFYNVVDDNTPPLFV